MKEVSPVRFYFAKYFLLALGILQLIVAMVVFTRFGNTAKSQLAAFVILTIAMILFAFQWIWSDKVRRVAISKKKIAIIYPKKVKRYDWGDVKQIRFLAFFNLYSLQLKGKKSKIYFPASQGSETVFSLFNREPDFIPKKISKA